MTMKNSVQANSTPNSGDLKYTGVRKRKWGKWVSEIRLPHSRERIWLGSYDAPEKAARAFDAAQFCLRGRSANFNFPDDPPEIDGAARGLSNAEIQVAAARFANAEAPTGRRSSSQPTPEVETAPAAEEEQEASTPSCPLSPSDGDVSFDGGPAPFYDWYDFSSLVTMDPGNYEAEFGFGELYASQQPNSSDYELYDNWNGSGCENSFLWNF